MENLENKIKYISSYTSKLLRNKFGRGPESCFAFAGNHFLILHIRGFLSPIEEVLIKEKQDTQVDYLRNVVIRSILDELKGVIQVTLETDVIMINHDWNYPNNTGVIIVELQDQLLEVKKDPEVDFSALVAEIERISLLVQKIPDETEICQISPRVIVVKRFGILINIEKALIEKGFESELYVTKDALEKSYFHRDNKFDDIFKKPVKDVFIDWKLDEDYSVMCFLLK
ncbi:Na-translocating system protein MpsC family protein [Fredinandcohnia humi]